MKPKKITSQYEINPVVSPIHVHWSWFFIGLHSNVLLNIELDLEVVRKRNLCPKTLTDWRVSKCHDRYSYPECNWTMYTTTSSGHSSHECLWSHFSRARAAPGFGVMQSPPFYCHGQQTPGNYREPTGVYNRSALDSSFTGYISSFGHLTLLFLLVLNLQFFGRLCTVKGEFVPVDAKKA